MFLLKKLFTVFGWMAGLSFLTKALAIGKIAILARILTPSQFGSYGIALLVLGFLEVMTETGINIFLIQERDNAKQYLNSAWVVSIIRGLLIAVVIIAIAPLVVGFYDVDHVYPLLYLVAGVAFVRGFINPMIVSFQKELQFNKVFMFQGSLYLIDVTLAVLIGIATKSEASMIVSMLIAALIEVVLSFIVFNDKPKFIFEKEKFLKVINAGKWITGAGTFGYLLRNIDNVVVGKVLGTSQLGLYQQSYSIATLPVTGVSDIYSKVMFPRFTKVIEDKQKLKSIFIRSTYGIFFVTLIFSFLLIVFTKPIVLLFLGDKWLGIIPSLKVLAIFGLIRSIVNSSYSLLLSLKMQREVMISELCGILSMLVLIYPMVKNFGIIGAAYSAIIASLFSLPAIIISVKRIFKDV